MDSLHFCQKKERAWQYDLKQASMCMVMCPGDKLDLMEGSLFFVGNSSEAIENKRGRGYYSTTPIPILYSNFYWPSSL